jgi:LPS-assembly protein
VREIVTWELKQKYFFDPTFGGALVPGQRNVFTTTAAFSGIAFLTAPRRLTPLASRLRIQTSARSDAEWDADYDFKTSRLNASTILLNHRFGPFTVGGGDATLSFLQYSTVQINYNWDCCGLSLEYRRFALGSVRNENQFRFNFTLANITSIGNLRRQERLF